MLFNPVEFIIALTVKESPHKVIRLNFSAKGAGRAGDSFYMYALVDRCVVCGVNSSLLRHNVVPREYRVHFPVALKSHASHDVVSLCGDCAVAYSPHQTQLKKTLMHEYDVKDEVQAPSLELRRAHRAATLLLKHLNRSIDDGLPDVNERSETSVKYSDDFSIRMEIGEEKPEGVEDLNKTNTKGNAREGRRTANEGGEADEEDEGQDMHSAGKEGTGGALRCRTLFTEEEWDLRAPHCGRVERHQVATSAERHEREIEIKARNHSGKSIISALPALRVEELEKVVAVFLHDGKVCL